ncbi:MAG: recombinase family protein [Anaerolineae bacterium]|nr:recombinase family protein [Anaerolineae bacterium]
MPPLGYDLVTTLQATPEHPAGLYINPEQAEVVLRAFERYSTGHYSDSEIAQWMNTQPVIQRLRMDKKPVGKETVRDMLQNRTYLGYVAYCETEYSGTLGQGKRSSRHRKVWMEGKHEGFIPEPLFEDCQSVRAGLARKFKTDAVMRTYVLHDRVYCAHCVSNMPSGLVDENYGKMRPYWDHRREYGYYRCLCKERGYRPCPQHAVREESVNEQVIDVLTHLEIPDNFRERVEAAVRDRVENEAALKRMEEIREIIERVDLRWDHGFISQEEYVEKRGQLQREIEALRPIDYDELHEAADLIQYFRTYWDGCADMENPAHARQQLLQKIVDQVFIYRDRVIAVALHGNFSVILNTGEDEMPGELAEVLKQNGCAIIFNDAQPGRERRASHYPSPQKSTSCSIRLLVPVFQTIRGADYL